MGVAHHTMSEYIAHVVWLVVVCVRVCVCVCVCVCVSAHPFYHYKKLQYPFWIERGLVFALFFDQNVSHKFLIFSGIKKFEPIMDQIFLK